MIDDRLCRWCHEDLPKGAETLCASCQDKEAMLKEGLTTAPDLMDSEALSRFFWKLAVYAIQTMEPKMNRKRLPRFTLPHVRASLAAPILKALPMHYISLIDEPENDPEELVRDITYTLKAPIPRTLLYEVVEKLGIWNKIEPEPDNFTGA